MPHNLSPADGKSIRLSYRHLSAMTQINEVQPSWLFYLISSHTHANSFLCPVELVWRNTCPCFWVHSYDATQSDQTPTLKGLWKLDEISEWRGLLSSSVSAGRHLHSGHGALADSAASLWEACHYVGENNTERFGQNLSDKIKNEDDPEETEEARDSPTSEALCVLPYLRRSYSAGFFISSLNFCWRNSIRGHSHILRLFTRVTASLWRGGYKGRNKSEDFLLFFFKTKLTTFLLQCRWLILHFYVCQSNLQERDNLQVQLHNAN